MPPNIFQFDPHKVQEVVTLGKENDNHAQELLNQAARQVQPIIRKREWVVPKLSEFYPNNPNLLGLNIGGGGGQTKEIKVRLRRAGSINDFFPYEHILGTLLHELSHNIHGPHNASFYKLLDELTAECEELMAKGIAGTGQGFDAPSVGRLGSYSYIPQHNPPSTELRNTMIKAAEERAKRLRLSAGPQKLGGDVTTARHLTPAQAAARAAERRLRDNLWCPTEQLHDNEAGPQEPSGSLQGTKAPAGSNHRSAQPNKPQATVAAKTQHTSHAAAGPSTSSCAAPSRAGTTALPQTQPRTSSISIDLTMSDDEEHPQPGTRPPLATLRANNATQQPAGTRLTNPSQLRAHMRWCCPMCTLFNQPVLDACDACMAPRPAAAQPTAASQAAQPNSKQSTQPNATQPPHNAPAHEAGPDPSSSKRQAPWGSQRLPSQPTATIAAGQPASLTFPPSVHGAAAIARTAAAVAAAAAAERRLGGAPAHQAAVPAALGPSSWDCLMCTLRNSATSSCCDACGTCRATVGAAFGIAS